MITRTAVILFLAAVLMAPQASAEIPAAPLAELNQALAAAKDGASPARQRLAVRRVIRDAEQLVESQKDTPARFPTLEFLFRARQQLIALDNDAEHRAALLETCRELVQAPDEFADLRLEADLLLTQADAARQGANAEARGKALRPFIARYVDTPSGAKALRMTLLLALELGDNTLINDLQQMIAERFAADPEMIAFQRDKLGGQVFGAPFAGVFESADGTTYRFPMDALGRTTVLFFWSKEGPGTDFLKGLAAASKERSADFAGRLAFVSINLDDLPDAGESIVRSHGVDWPVLRLPGGRDHPIYNAYARTDPRLLSVSPTGITALIQAETVRGAQTTAAEIDYTRMLQSTSARSWVDARYTAQLASLMAGDFLVFDPEGPFDPTRPPEHKAANTGTPLARGANSVPEATLQAIQECFAAPPRRYRLSHSEILANYTQAADLSRKAIAAHPDAPDLWIVRNRLITALVGLWKTSANPAHHTAAIAESEAALAAGYPPGCDIIPRLCIARGQLRSSGADPMAILAAFRQATGGENAPGPALAAAALLALDTADRKSFTDLRAAILEEHTESPMMWTFTAFLLDRHHAYWLFQEPFTAGWSYGRRLNYAMQLGDHEPARRILRTELQTLEGKPFRIPEDLDSPWTILVFGQPGPWSRNREDALPANPEGITNTLAPIITSRPPGDVKVHIAMLGDDAKSILAGFGDKEPTVPILTVPNGIANPLVHRLGILSEDTQHNSVLIDKNGRIAAMISGVVEGGRGGASALANVIAQQDEEAASALLESGDIQAAKDLIWRFAPPFDPEAVDDRGRKLKKPNYNLAHLRARARVHAALKEWPQALADAEEVVQQQLGKDGGMSLRTPELEASEALRASIQEQIKAMR
jgi:hypothetical protein